jgi:hypothetical protein
VKIAGNGREQGAVIDELMANCLDLQARQPQDVEAGLADAEAANFVSGNG